MLDWNETKAIPVTFTPSDTTYRDLSWASSDESVATVENGLVTTYGKTDVVTITATSEHLSAPVTLSVNVADRTIHVSSISLSAPAAIEIGKPAEFAVDVQPENAKDRSVEYVYDHSKLDVQKVGSTLYVTGLEEGNVTIKAIANDNGVSSSESTINVYEVKVDAITNKDVTLSFEKGLEQDFEAIYTTDTTGVEKASKPNFTYTVADPSIAKYEDGKLVAVKAGTTELTIVDTRSGKSGTINVTVDYSIKTIAVTGEKSVKIGSTLSLGASIDPTTVPSKMITWESDNPTIATVDANGKVKGYSVGTANIYASVGAAKSVAFPVTVTRETTDSFLEGKVYLVGNRDFSTGKSIGIDPNDSSWNVASRAYLFTESMTPDTLSQETAKVFGRVYLEEDTTVKVRYNSADWLDLFDVNEAGEPAGYHYEKEGAIKSGALVLDENPGGNVTVTKTGWYDIYFKVYESGWHSVYFGEHSIEVDRENIYVKPTEEAALKVSNWNGELHVDVKEGDTDKISVTEVDEHGNWKVKSLLSTEGTASVIVKDDINTITVTVHVGDLEIDEAFVSGHPYIVGSKSYIGGVSEAGASWDDPTRAYKLVEKALPDTGVDTQWEAKITFKQNDEWKFRIGPDATSDYIDSGCIEVNGGLLTGDVEILEGGNIKVKTAGAYTIQFKKYVHEDTSVTYGAYISNITEAAKVEISVEGLENIAWRNEKSESLYLWGEDFEPLGSFDVCNGNLGGGKVSLNLTKGKSITGGIFFFWEGSQLHKTSDFKLNITAAGSYKVVIAEKLSWAASEEKVIVDGIKFVAEGESAGADISGGQEEAETFVYGTPYIVGNKDYHTGTSIASETGSWGDVEQAYTLVSKDPDEGVVAQWEAKVTFAKDDEWKFRIGKSDTDYISPNNIERNGALLTGDMVLLKNDKDEYTNVKVVTPGEYTIQFKKYVTDGVISYGAYVSNITPLYDKSVKVEGTMPSDWTNVNVASYSLYVYGEDGEYEPLGSFDACSGNLGNDSHSLTFKTVGTHTVDHAVFYFWQQVGEEWQMKQTKDLVIPASATGEYKIVIGDTITWDSEVGKIGSGVSIVPYVHALSLAKESESLLTTDTSKEIAILDKATGSTVTATSADTSKVEATVVGDNVVLTPVAVTTEAVEVTVSDGTTNKIISVTVAEPTPEFKVNIPYVVGDHDLHTGTSTGEAAKANFTDPTKGYETSVSTEPLPSGCLVQYDAHVYLNKDVQFKVLIGANYWDASYENLSSLTGYIHQQEDGDHNLVVDKAGMYHIYVKCMDNNGGWKVVINPHIMSVNKESIDINADDETTIRVSNWNGDLSVASSDTSIVKVTKIDENGNYKVEAIKNGEAKIVIEDDYDKIEITVKVAPVFKEGVAYIVSDKDISTGTMTGESAKANFTDPTKAYECEVSTEPLPDGATIQYSASFDFAVGDTFKVLIGPNYWGVNYDEVGVLVTAKAVEFDSDGNIVVKKAGTYDVYVKCMDYSHGGGWKVVINATTATVYVKVFWDADWVYNDTANVLAYAWGGDAGEGTWYNTVYGGDGHHLYVELPANITKFKLVRVPNGKNKDNVTWSDKLNESSEDVLVANTYVYKETW